MNVYLLLLLFSLAILIVRRPYLGIVFTAASLPVIDLTPPIPGFTSIVSAAGAVTLVGFLLRRLAERGKPLIHLGSVHILGLLLIGWLYFSNPIASWLGITRNWIFTFLQLWVLVWLTGELMDTTEKHQVLMWVFSLATIVSAAIAIQQGRIGSSIYTSSRVAGLAEGPNAAARYFVVGMVFSIYLRENSQRNFSRLLATGGVIFSILGAFFTVSRTGMLLLFSAWGLLFLLQRGGKYRTQMILFFAAAWLVIWSFYDGIMKIITSILPSIAQGTDTIGLRYGLWRAAFKMWLDHHILQGVGIGMYPVLLKYYGQGLVPSWYMDLGLAFQNQGLVTHNMYIQILAETGLIGFTLFMLILFISLRNIWREGSEKDQTGISLRNVWLIVFIIMLLGGVTKSDQIDKLVWMVIGISVYFQGQIRASGPRGIRASQLEVPVDG